MRGARAARRACLRAVCAGRVRKAGGRCRIGLSCRGGCPKRERKAIAMMKVGLPRRMAERPIASGSADFLDHRGERQLAAPVGQDAGLDAQDIEALAAFARHRSEEHTSELQSLMRISYAVLCLQKTTKS